MRALFTFGLLGDHIGDGAFIATGAEEEAPIGFVTPPDHGVTPTCHNLNVAFALE
jgi:hypothetical protein